MSSGNERVYKDGRAVWEAACAPEAGAPSTAVTA